MGIIQTGKELAKLAQQFGNIEIKQKVIEVQEQVLAIQDEVQKLRQENEELKNVAKIDSELRLHENAYYRDGAPDTRRGPFCKRCWDVDSKLVNLDDQATGSYFCMECKNSFSTPRSRAETKRFQEANQPKSDYLSPGW